MRLLLSSTPLHKKFEFKRASQVAYNPEAIADIAPAEVILICGGREFSYWDWGFSCLEELDAHFKCRVVIHGAANGADAMGDHWARMMGKCIWGFRADWNRFGGDAGPKRNQQMLREGQPDAVVAFPGGRGTADMKRRVIAARIPLIEWV